MQSPRSLIVSILALMAIGLVVSVLGMHQEPDSDGVGRDTFGLHAHGYRGAYEVLETLGIETSRRISPPADDLPLVTTVALLAPTPPLVAREPAYLHRLADWVRLGGRVVVAPSTTATRQRLKVPRMPGQGDPLDAELMGSLGLDYVSLREDNPAPSDPDEATTWRGLVSRSLRPTDTEAYVGPQGKRLSLATTAGEFISVSVDSEENWRPLLQRERADKTEGVLAAVFSIGNGEIVVVADPDLFANGLLGKDDNSVAVVEVLSPRGGPVVFDEHYHGLSVRGNPLYLLTRPAFAAVTLSLLAAAGIWAWRTAIPLGPPVITPAKPRRDLSEYVQAMANLLLRGSDGRGFLLRELRQGTLEEIGRQLGFAEITPAPDRIAAGLARRDRPRAVRFTSAIDTIDRRLGSTKRLGITETTQLMQRATTCL